MRIDLYFTAGSVKEGHHSDESKKNDFSFLIFFLKVQIVQNVASKRYFEIQTFNEVKNFSIWPTRDLRSYTSDLLQIL